MARLFKLGTREKSGRAKQQTSGDWFGKVRLAPYDFKRVRLCTDRATSESWCRSCKLPWTDTLLANRRTARR
ncbi:MAG: hypothetical protein MI923_22535 [Phycisphaerales bacterium]|nr:hypothetical protein [Phycisphaerales bacterium]